MVNLKAKPFYLNDQQICWVEQSIKSMSLEEKLGQLFVIMTCLPGVDESARLQTRPMSKTVFIKNTAAFPC